MQRFLGPYLRAGVVLCLALLGAAQSLAEPIATVEVTDGTVYMKQAAGKLRILAKGASVEVGDTITTEKDSYAKLRFTDGSELAIRPASSIRVNDYHFKDWQPTQDSFSMRLIKGGLRTITGLIGKRGDPDVYRLEGATAVIGIRGTDFIARLCENDCVAEERQAETAKKKEKDAKASTTPIAPTIVARLLTAEGKAQVSTFSAPARTLNPGDPLYVGDTVQAAMPGFATVVFTDGTKVVVNAGSAYKITAYHFTPQGSSDNHMLTELIKGGIRVVTGLIGKQRPSAVRYHTVIATIGIRGTNFDMACVPAGGGGAAAILPAGGEAEGGGGGGASPCDDALYTNTREGTTEVTSGQFKILVPQGKIAYVDTPGGKPALVEQLPAILRDNPAPKPETLDVKPQELFGQDGTDVNKAGLYVLVKDGKVELTQANANRIELKAGESGFAGVEGMELFKMGVSPPFIDLDNYLRDMDADPVSCRAK